MHRFTTEFILLAGLCLWLFNLLSYVKQPIKDAVNSVVIILLVLFWFVL